MQAITTKYIGPTNFRGSRVKATAQAGSVTIPWDCAHNADENHRLAARILATKLGWNYAEWISGWNHNGDMVWICDVCSVNERFEVAPDIGATVRHGYQL